MRHHVAAHIKRQPLAVVGTGLKPENAFVVGQRSTLLARSEPDSIIGRQLPSSKGLPDGRLDLLRTLGADAGEQGGGRFVLRVLGHEPALEGGLEDAPAEPPGQEGIEALFGGVLKRARWRYAGKR